MQSRAEEQGTTLVEVAVAMSTVAILAFGIMLGFTTAGVQDRQSYEVSRSQNVCVSMLEQVESADYTELLQIAGAPPLQFAVGRWRFSVQVTQIQGDLLALEATCQEASSGSYPVRLVTLKTLKEELI